MKNVSIKALTLLFTLLLHHTIGLTAGENDGWLPTINLSLMSDEKIKELEQLLKNLTDSVGKNLAEYIKENELLKTNDAAQSFLESWQSNKLNIEPVIKQVDQINQTLKETNKTLDNVKNSFDTSIINTHNAQATQKSLIIGLMGLVVGGFSIKLLYEGVCDITTKLDRPEHQNQSWYQALEYRDYFKPTLGLVGVFTGFGLIAKSDTLARMYTS